MKIRRPKAPKKRLNTDEFEKYLLTFEVDDDDGEVLNIFNYYQKRVNDREFCQELIIDLILSKLPPLYYHMVSDLLHKKIEHAEI